MGITNPIKDPLNELFIRLNTLYGLLFHLDNQLDNFRKLLKQSLGKSSIDLSNIVAGSSLAIRDLTEWPEDKWAKYYPSGKFVSQGARYLQITDTLIHRAAAWTISQAYEAFETFLKDITATFLYIHSNYADTEKLRKSESKLEQLSLKPTNIEYWKEFVRQNYQKNIELLKYLRKTAPELKEAEQQNNRAINLTEWYIVATEVRHAATHSNMLIKAKKMLPWSPTRRQLLTDFFPGKNTGHGYELELTPKNAETNLVLFNEYAFVIFKCLSKLENYNWRILAKVSESHTS